MWPRENYFTKDDEDGMTFPFQSHVRLEQDNLCKALGSRSC